ncbi:hypothetical protein HN51_046405 [Arachis hypogaea]|uniref:Uncharacterized protein n=1 Tax=Arachis hypogaea TaxID=3818 RepID=A0A445ACM2_ARAHY|nr:uncharacterized protein LOC107623980 [Arachis ipaensis]XP_016181895.1 uncharacterized protein LOC107623980 [Arachis ipaensis]XP_016181916.1 uncharacterized protein LOC107623980 [Arachis ipaensis]XP_016181923.1 uncharacterized protein LOC107623980 [Arachis ipaensis]XP_020970910.1 uncharacterized protein LOC107623980 [Arachis ipaensis]XP_025631758.1 uncharacterized protein LOC112726550 [Arachis hypogaea]XP_025631760.1 uncharacterized protein LOC112726550 [Arachis hypogaea]XP_025631761.1 unc
MMDQIFIVIIIVGLIIGILGVSAYRNFLVVLPILLLKDPTKPAEHLVSYLLLPVSVKLLAWVTSGICTDIFGSEKVVGIIIIALSLMMEFLRVTGLVGNEFYICGFGFLEGATKIVGAILISRRAGRVNAGWVIFSAIYLQCLVALSSEIRSMTKFTDIPSPSDVHRIYAFRIFVPGKVVVTVITTCLAVGYGFYCYWKRPIWAQLRQQTHHEFLMVIAGISFLSGLSYLSQLLYLNLIFRSAPLVPPANLKTLLLIAILVFVCLVFFSRHNYRCLIFVVFFILKATFMVNAFCQTPFKKEDYGLELFWPYFIDNTISNVVNATIVVVAAESFPEETRAACLVISGAAGMLGEILAALWFLRAGHRIRVSFFLLVVISLIAVFTSVAVPDPPNNQQNPAPPNNQQDNQQNPAPPNNQPGDHQE